MTYKNFLKIAKKFQTDYINFEELKCNKDTLYCTYRTGGNSGGDCWGGVAEKYTNDEPMDEFDEFYSVLEKVAPNISFLQFKVMFQKLVKSDTKTDCEYYGNSATYFIRYVNLKEMYDYLVEKKLIA